MLRARISLVTRTQNDAQARAEMIAKAKASIAAKMASFNQGAAKLGGPSPASIPAAKPSASTNATTASGTKPPVLDIAAMARQVAEAKRLAMASQASKAVQENPYLVSCQPSFSIW